MRRVVQVIIPMRMATLRTFGSWRMSLISCIENLKEAGTLGMLAGLRKRFSVKYPLAL